MLRKRQLIRLVVLLGLGFGIFRTPVQISACENATIQKACCCCPMKKAADCPMIKKSSSSPLAVIPGQPTVSYVAFVELAPVRPESALTTTELKSQSSGLSPPRKAAASPSLLRAPPVLA